MSESSCWLPPSSRLSCSSGFLLTIITNSASFPTSSSSRHPHLLLLSLAAGKAICASPSLTTPIPSASPSSSTSGRTSRWEAAGLTRSLQLLHRQSLQGQDDQGDPQRHRRCTPPPRPRPRPRPPHTPFTSSPPLCTSLAPSLFSPLPPPARFSLPSPPHSRSSRSSSAGPRDIQWGRDQVSEGQLELGGDVGKEDNTDLSRHLTNPRFAFAHTNNTNEVLAPPCCPRRLLAGDTSGGGAAEGACV
eukprot:747424-Hanusia_phi.AAC.6